MTNKMIKLLKEACEDNTKFKSIELMYNLYDQLQYCENLNEMAKVLYDWLKSSYSIDNIDFSLFDMEHSTNYTILKEGGEFFLDGELSFYFIVNTHTNINAVISFSANDQQHYESINQKQQFIDASFFQISPILQNGIMKKHHIEASSIDSVTNVHNRKYLVEHIHKLITLSKNKEENITFLMVGIDRFKAVIDEFDYDIGDKVLIELAKVIHSNIKDFDIVARLTGDEFLVALINLPDPKLAQNVAQRIIDQFAKVEVVVDDETMQTLKKTVCVGIASYPQDNDDIDQVLKYADMFLYEAKNKGRSSYAVYVPEEESSIDLF